MKTRRQPIPQDEFGFAVDVFSLEAERARQSPPSAPTIMAELPEPERERIREQSRANMPGLVPGSHWGDRPDASNGNFEPYLAD